MPSIPVAITINTTIVSPTATSAGWGAGALIGTSTATAKNTPKRYTSLAALQTDHGTDTAVGIAAKSAFAQGIAELYAVSVSVADTTPTAAEITAALNSLADVVASQNLGAVALAGIHSDAPTLTAALKTWAEANRIIFAVSNPAGETVEDIIAAAEALDTEYGIFLAHATTGDMADDVGAALLGVIVSADPGDTLAWDAINLSGIGKYTAADGAALEAARVNYVIDLENNGQLRLSNDLSLTSDADAVVQYIDILISRAYTERRIRDAIARYRIDTRKLPYTQAGIDTIRSLLVSALAELADTEQVLADYTVSMPALADIPAETIKSRILPNIAIRVKLAGNMQEFVINLTLEAI